MPGAPQPSMTVPEMTAAGMSPQQQIIMQMQQPQAMAGGGPGAGSMPARQPRVLARRRQSTGAAQGQTLKTVGNLVDENPKQAAMIVRDWLSSAGIDHGRPQRKNSWSSAATPITAS